MTLNTSYQTSTQPATHLPRLFALIRADRVPGGGFRYSAYFSASYLAECFIDQKPLRHVLLEPVHALGLVDNLPLGDCDLNIVRTPEAYTAIPGEVMQVSASWPSEQQMDRELAL